MALSTCLAIKMCVLGTCCGVCGVALDGKDVLVRLIASLYDRGLTGLEVLAESLRLSRVTGRHWGPIELRVSHGRSG